VVTAMCSDSVLWSLGQTGAGNPAARCHAAVSFERGRTVHNFAVALHSTDAGARNPPTTWSRPCSVRSRCCERMYSIASSMLMA
jgi:hypothetical protein